MLDSVFIPQATPTVTTGSAYASGNLVGNAALQFKITPFQEVRGCAILEQLLIMDQDKQASNYDLVLFNQLPPNTSFNDKAAFDVNSADMATVLAVLSATTQVAFANTGATKAGQLSTPIKLPPAGAGGEWIIYGALITRSTPNFTHANGLVVSLSLHLPGLDPRPM